MRKNYDYLIVGAGFYGSICAYELQKKGYKVIVIDKREHIGGNCYTSNRDGIQVHDYGPHVFHTSNDMVWDWINQFVRFNNYQLNSISEYKGEIYSIPFNMYTFEKILGVNNPYDVKKIIEKGGKNIKNPQNLEEQAIKTLGIDIYEKLVVGYVIKQWGKHPRELPKEIIKRLPVRFTYDTSYYSHEKYTGVPIGGYTQIFDQLLENVDVRLGKDYLGFTEYWDGLAGNIIFTGPIDEFFKYKYGELEYKTTRFQHTKIEGDNNYQGTALKIFPDIEVPYTRVTEHIHFDPVETNCTWVTHEFPTKFQAGRDTPLYPVNDLNNTQIYNKYKIEAAKYPNIHFGGRLAEYKYYDMEAVINSALTYIKCKINE